MHGSVGLVYTSDVAPDATSTADRVGQIAGPAHGQEHTGAYVPFNNKRSLSIALALKILIHPLYKIYS